DPLTPLQNSLNRLLTLTAAEAEGYGGYYTALDQSSLTVAGISKEDDGAFLVDLRGQVRSKGVCDDPRIRAQIEKTVGRFGSFEIRLNGRETGWRCFDDQSGKCR
ncbi:MAG: hypothetical protein AB1715_14650, partial [Acidobacteriota bacterium]